MAYGNKNRGAYNGNNNSANKGNEIANLNELTRHLISLKDDFVAASAWNPTLDFAKESVFAKHVINNSVYLTGLALQNLKSFEVAFLQLATSGLTLDPSQKLAYLVPRMGRVFLDVSYLGLSRMATEEGLCQDIVVELVFENDTFVSKGRRQSPEHSYDPFAEKGNLLLSDGDEGVVGDRGNFRGVYVDYAMKDGRNLVYFLTKAELSAARAVSESWKKTEERHKSPWVNFPWAMVRKSAIKQTIHLIPGNRTKISSVIEYLNKEGGEGFRDINATPIQSAEFEMSARHAANQHDLHTKSSNSTSDRKGDVLEGEVVSTDASKTSSGSGVKHSTSDHTQSPVNGTVTPKGADSNTPEVNTPSVEMSEVPGVRATVFRRIKKLVIRVEKTLAYETMLSEVRSAFEFNDYEINHAVHCLEQSRRFLLQVKLTDAVTKCDFEEVTAFIEKLADGEFKDKSLKFMQSLQLQTARLRDLFDTATLENDYSSLESEIKSVEFEPLKKVLSEMVISAKAA